MNLSMSRQGRIGRWYLWSEGIWTAFSGGAAPNGYTNLCRTFWVLIGAPFVILWQVAAIIGAIAVVGPLPVSLFGWESTLYSVAVTIVAILGFGVAICVFWLFSGEGPIRPYIKAGAHSVLSFVGLVYHAIKDRFCPIIRLEEGQ